MNEALPILSGTGTVKGHSREDVEDTVILGGEKVTMGDGFSNRFIRSGSLGGIIEYHPQTCPALCRSGVQKG